MISVARTAFALRDLFSLRLTTDALLQLPLPDSFRDIAHYFEALCENREGRPGRAIELLEAIADRGRGEFRPGAMLGLAFINFERGDLDLSSEYFKEGYTLALTSQHWAPSIPVASHVSLRAIQDLRGDHTGALRQLESAAGMVLSVAPADPHLFYTFQNSMAVALGEVGRLEEALHRSNTAVSSRFSQVYPQWHETKRDILAKMRRRSRSVISLYSSDRTPVHETRDVEEEDPTSPPARNVIVFPGPGANNLVNSTPPSDFVWSTSKDDYLDSVLSELREETASEATADGIHQSPECQGQAPVDRLTRLEEGPALENMVRLWVNGTIEPEQFAAVISLLRDCSDDLRRNSIMDRIITYSFMETRDRIQCENEWRKRVESIFDSPTD